MSAKPKQIQATPKDLKHELRTLITAIMGYIELVREAFEVQQRKKGEFPPDLENIWLAANLLAALVEDSEPVSGKGYEGETPSKSALDMNDTSEAGQRLRAFVFKP